MIYGGWPCTKLAGLLDILLILTVICEIWVLQRNNLKYANMAYYIRFCEGWYIYPLMALFHCMVRHGTVRYGSLLGGFPLGTVPGTWYFFSTTSAEVPSVPYRYQNVACKLCWSLIGRRKSSLLRHWTWDMRPSSTALPARFKSAQPAKDRTQLLFKQTHIFASTTK